MRRLTGVLAALACIAARPLHSQVTPGRARLVEELRISPGEADTLAFSSVADIEIGPDGVLYVLQPDARVVQVFDSLGRRVRTIGRRGSGPGEFQFPLRLGMKQDSLWVWDPTTARISIFDDGGRVRRTISVGALGSARLLATGDVVVKRYDEDAVRVASGRLSAPLLKFSAQGAMLDTLLALEAESVGPLLIPFGAGIAQGPQPFSSSPLWALSPTGWTLVLVERHLAERPGAAFLRIRRVAVDGRVAFTREVAYVARSVEDADIDAAVDSWYERLSRPTNRRSAGSGVRREQIRRAIHRPKTLPAVSDLLIGRDDRIWLRRTDARRPEVDTWMLIDADGGFVQDVEAPAGALLLRASSSHVWGVVRDADGVPSVVRYRIRT